MPRLKLLFAALAVASAALIWHGANSWPLTRVTSHVISTDGAPQQSVTLTAGQTATQTFRATQPLISSVSIFAFDHRLTNQKFTLYILDEDGQVLSDSTLTQQSYQGDRLQLTWPVDWVITYVGQPLTLELTLVKGDPIQLFTLKENTYRPGQFKITGQPAEQFTDLDLSVSTTSPTPTSAAIKRGVIAGLVILLGVLAISLLPRQRTRLRLASAIILIIIVTPLALSGFLINLDKIGINDWDYYFSSHHVLRESLLTQQTFPHWNPYICGGTAGLADPEFPVFTATFLLELIFGVPLGLRLAIMLSTMVGATGLLFLARRLGLSLNAALLAAIIAFFGSVNLLEIVEGHPNIFAAMWIPWIFWAWLAAYRHRKLWPMFTGIILALTFFQGGIYLLFYTGISFLILIALVKNKRAALSITIQAGFWAIGFSAIKLIPAVYWLSQFQDANYASSTTTLPYLYEILLGRHLHGSNILPNQSTGWHEYGAYIGPIALALAIIGLTKLTTSRLARILVIAILLAVALSTAGPLLEPIFDQIPIIPRSTISRVIFFAIIPLSLLAGLGLDKLKAWSPLLTLLFPIIIGLIALDLMTFSSSLSHQAFILPTTDVQISPAPAPLAFTNNTYEKRINGVDYTRSYLAARAGYGTLSYCTPLSPNPSVIVQESEYDSSIATLSDENKGSIELLKWSPNQIVVAANILEPTDVLINTNYASGWNVNRLPARDIAGRVGLPVQPGNHTLAFTYRTPGWRLGLTIWFLTIIAAIYFLFSKRK